jgi:hypothetical protein
VKPGTVDGGNKIRFDTGSYQGVVNQSGSSGFAISTGDANKN